MFTGPFGPSITPALHHSAFFPAVQKLDTTAQPKPSGLHYRSPGASTAQFVTDAAPFVTDVCRICDARFLGKHGLVTL